MSLALFVVVITASVLQAWWNFHLKKIETDKSAFLLVSWMFFGVISTPISLLFLDKPFSMTWVPFILSSGVAQGFYLVLLCWAYTVADISLVYPIARGLSIGLTTVVLTFMGAHNLTPTGTVGIISVVIGSVCLGSFEFKDSRSRAGILLAVALAVVVTTYSVVDSFGAKEIPVIFYVLFMNITAPVFAFPFLWRGRKKAIKAAWRDHKWRGLAVAAAGSGGYLIVLLAYQRAPAPYVLALREVSIVFATILGVKYLGEKVYLRKVIGICLILAGILLVKMA
jgi:drug/metabolite transporter (DMT)-like permease